MGCWQTSLLPSKNYCGQPRASQDLSPWWNGKRGSRLFIPAARLSLAIKFCVWKVFFLPSILQKKKKKNCGRERWGRECWAKIIFCYYLFNHLKEKHQPSRFWVDLLNINPFQHLRERKRRKKAARTRSEREKREEGRYLKSRLRDGVLTSLEFELLSDIYFKFHLFTNRYTLLKIRFICGP